MKSKSALDAEAAAIRVKEAEAETALRAKCGRIGNIVDPKVPVSMNEDDNRVEKKWHPDGDVEPAKAGPNMLPHHQVMARLGGLEAERGVKVAGHRGYFLMDDLVDLNLALISHGLATLRKAGYTKIMTPFMMRKSYMGKTAQLEEFDESLYNVCSILILGWRWRWGR